MQQINKIKAYIYPITGRNNSGVHNPYRANFTKSSENFINYLNKKHPSNIGILNLFRFIHKTDLLILNWIEDLPDKKGGLFQYFVFYILLRFKKFSRFKIVWILHNKFSHSSSKLFFKKSLFFSLLKRSDIIITHSKEGINFAESFLPGVSSKIFYFPHPIVSFKGPIKNNVEKKYDILIWGTLAPYKGIYGFLEFLSANNALNKYRILIAGKAVSSEFFRELQKFKNENIKIRNKFLEEEELKEMVHESKAILFTYSGNSVLSSGALIDSISFGGLVIGPNVGAFSDMGAQGIIKTYDTLSDLLVLLERLDNLDSYEISRKIIDFVNSHTWSEFSKEFEKKLKAI